MVTMVIYIHQTSAVALFLFKLPTTTTKKIQDEVQTSKYLVYIGGRLLTQALPQGSALYLQCVTALYKSRGHSLGTSPAGCSTPLLCLPKEGLGEGEYCMKRPPFQFPRTIICEGNKLREGGKQL